ncbi:unnamed protein product [Nesidiocoris tenuis]|uniref:Uncharacterized protein n=1 Tax=Nesidiocoris tenuis TaxID=355587 RepID=A0A6H5FZ90_9HEMI|nr:unnamed protein product [Nesidiocoris tenuis]
MRQNLEEARRSSIQEVDAADLLNQPVFRTGSIFPRTIPIRSAPACLRDSPHICVLSQPRRRRPINSTTIRKTHEQVPCQYCNRISSKCKLTWGGAEDGRSPPRKALGFPSTQFDFLSRYIKYHQISGNYVIEEGFPSIEWPLDVLGPFLDRVTLATVKKVYPGSCDRICGGQGGELNPSGERTQQPTCAPLEGICSWNKAEDRTALAAEQQNREPVKYTERNSVLLEVLIWLRSLGHWRKPGRRRAGPDPTTPFAC